MKDNIVAKFLNTAKSGNCHELRSILAQKLVDVDVADYDSRTALHVAASQGDSQTISCLKEFGADVNVLDSWKGSPLDDAIRGKHWAAADRLLSYGARVGDPEKANAELLRAVQGKEALTVQRLLSGGAEPNSCDYDHRYPIHVSVAKGQFEITSQLISAGALLNVKDDFGFSPLDEAERHATRLGNDRMVDLLLKSGAVKESTETVPRSFSIAFGLVQLGLIVAFGVGVRYSDALFTSDATTGMEIYPWFQDVHVMIFIGFGFLMTFLRRYAFSAVMMTMMVAVLCIQWHILMNGLMEQLFHIGDEGASFHYIRVDLVTFVLADFSAGAVLITFGAVLGKVSPTQLMCIGIAEIFFFTINENIALKLSVADVGGSMVVHAFGAYFGMATTYMLTPVTARGSAENATTYHSDVFSTIGTVFLWLFWPSFNGALAGPAQQRVVCNTVLALSGSAMGTFVLSQYLRGGRFCMVDLQNATLAGGVAIGSTANFAVHPAGAITVGVLSGFLSVCGYVKVQPLLEKIKIFDTCGVNNLHGMPGVFAALVSVGYSLFSTAEAYKCGSLAEDACQVGVVWGARSGDDPRSPLNQALIQLAFLGVTLAISTAGGLLTGFLVRFVSPMEANFFLDSAYFEVPELEMPFYFDKRSAGNNDLMERAVGKINHALPTKFDQRQAGKAKRSTSSTSNRVVPLNSTDLEALKTSPDFSIPEDSARIPAVGATSAVEDVESHEISAQSLV